MLIFLSILNSQDNQKTKRIDAKVFNVLTAVGITILPIWVYAEIDGITNVELTHHNWLVPLLAIPVNEFRNVADEEIVMMIEAAVGGYNDQILIKYAATPLLAIRHPNETPSRLKGGAS